MKRRSLLLSAAGAAGALIVGWGLLPPRSRVGLNRLLPDRDGTVTLNGWIKITLDGQVIVAVPRAEMGQGVHTALPMLVAEELDVPLSVVRVEQAGPDKIYGNVAMFINNLPFHPLDMQPGQETRLVKASEWLVRKIARELGIQVTGGSSSVADAWDVMRLAAATARARLLGAASLRWRLPVDELTVVDGVVRHASGQAASYGALAKAAAATPPGTVRLQARRDWKLIGTPAPRLDIPAKVNGSAVFGIDVRLPEMVHAVVRMCPMLGGSAGFIDTDATIRRPGVERVVRLASFGGSTAGVAVVGRSYWHALQAAQAMRIDWQAAPLGPLNSATIAQALRQAALHGQGSVFHSKGMLDEAEIGLAARTVEAVYQAPYLAHAAMEPINCTAQVKDGRPGPRVEVWASTQVPSAARAIAAQTAGVPLSAVHVHVTQLGGGFGRRLDVDFVGQAVRVAMETGGRPVQLVWPREEDIRHDFYRPAGAAWLRAGIDAHGEVVSWRIRSAGDAITPRWLERNLPALASRIELPDKTASEGLFDLPYGFAHQHIEHVATHSGVPVGYWRSVGHSHHAFFAECFIDELAHATQQDPVAFRRRWLQDAPRHLAVLDLAATQAGWGRPLPPGRARGVALHESFNSIVAQVAEVSLEDGRPRVHRVVCAIDCGTVVNPNIVAQQIESGVIFGLTAALHGRIDIVDSVVQQSNFPDYPLLTLAESPRVETHIVPSTRAPGGVGEVGTPPVAPAVANALFALTGQRLRSLPLAL